MLGAVNILKPTGWTSSDVVVKVRHILRAYYNVKDIKVGHLGTLDPAGSGVLPIVFGNATRLFDYFQYGRKLYRATFTFGTTTDTLDAYGKVIDTSDIVPNIIDIERAIPNFVGEIEQLPPKYSRISVDGVRACDASRKGHDIELATRKVNIYNYQVVDYTAPILTVDVSCSGGTYIRSLCRDLADALGTVGYMSSIIRLENKQFCIEDAVTIDELRENVEQNIISIDTILKDMDTVVVRGKEAFQLLNGVSIPSRGRDTDYIVQIEEKVFGICCDDSDSVKVIIRLWE